MSKIIRECHRRLCCSPKDLIEAPDAKPISAYSAHVPDKMVCKHCGQKFEYTRFMDAAGVMDSDYRKVK